MNFFRIRNGYPNHTGVIASMQNGGEVADHPTPDGESRNAGEPVGVALEPLDAGGLRSLGNACLRRGETDRAVGLLCRAVKLKPSNPAFHVDLASAYREQADFARSAGCCRTALMLKPDDPEALNALGLALKGLGRAVEAADQFRRVAALSPRMVEAHYHLGLVLTDQGQHAEAITQLQRAVELAPGRIAYRKRLAEVLLKQSQPEHALPHLQEAVRLRPGLADLHFKLGNALRDLNRLEDARAAYAEALRLDPTLIVANARIGITWKREGRLHEALGWFRKAVELDANNPHFWHRLGELHNERDEPEEGETCWRRALALSPPEPAPVHVGLGVALQDQGLLPAALEQFQTAARLQPELASPRHHLGVIHEQLGEMAEAEEAFRMALRLEPDFAAPFSRLATMLRDKLAEPDLVLLESRLADPKLKERPRTRLLFALAHVLDSRGDYTRAAELLREANALALKWADGYHAYDPADHERFIDALAREFSSAFFQRTAHTGSSTRRPVFIFGLPRSGTTLVEQVLASHPKIHGAGELRLARQSFDAIPSVLGRSVPPLHGVAYLDGPAIGKLAEQHLAKLHELDGGAAERIVDKMPDNYQQLGFLATLFPRAVFIHCRRDLRDIAVSCWLTDFSSIRWANDPAHIAERFRGYRRLMDHWRSVLPVPLHEVQYEETVADLEGVTRRLLAACELDWDPACLEFYRTRRPVRTASIAQVRQPVYTSSVARWRNYERELGALFDALPVNDAGPA